jgi:hypothetical protein
MRREGLILILILICIAGCTGKTANINPTSISTPHYDFTVTKPVSFCVGQGSQNNFEGGPSGYGGSALKARIDLKQIQEVVALKILNELYSKVDNYPQEVNIVSTLTNFSYRWPFKNKLHPRVMVSFVLSLSAKDKNNNQLYSNTITVKDSLGSYGKEVIGLSAAFLPLMQRDADKVSQLVGDTVLEKIYEIYISEFEKIAQINSSRTS